MHRANPTEFTAVPSEVLCLFFLSVTTPVLLSHITVILAVDVCVTSIYDVRYIDSSTPGLDLT